MRRHEWRQVAARTERSGSAGGARAAGERGELAVRHHLPAGNRAQRLRACAEKTVWQIERHVEEVIRRSGKESLHTSD